MRAKTVTLSARISHEDAEFISRLDIDGAKTPSDKLRHIITEARRRHEGSQDYRGSMHTVGDMLSTVNTLIREQELEHHVHSELVTRILDWLPDTMAFIMASEASLNKQAAPKQLLEIESGINERIFRLFESVLQLGITEYCPCYNNRAIQERVKPILELVQIIKTHEPSNKE